MSDELQIEPRVLQERRARGDHLQIEPRALEERLARGDCLLLVDVREPGDACVGGVFPPPPKGDGE